MLFKRLLILAVLSTIALLSLTGCQSQGNNYLNPEDFANYLRRNGVEVTGEPRPLPGDPFDASSGCAIMVGNSEIGIYKFDRSIRIFSDRIKKIEERGCVYVNALPFPVEVRGSFFIMGLEKNKKKHEIIRVFDKFY